jgi:kynurenine formamidase
LKEGRTLDQYPAETFIGSGCVVDVREAGPRIELALLQQRTADIDASDFLLLHSGWAHRWGQPEYFRGFPVLTPEAARWLVQAGLRGVGLDMISVDTVDSEDFPIHHILLEAGMVLIENLTGLGQLPAAGFEFSCLPMSLEEADGAPVRAVARAPGQGSSA